jgi:uncharacterized protein YecT (DUF1311 family)
MRAVLLSAALLSAQAAAAQDVRGPQVDCMAEDLTQSEMTFCAGQAFEAADGDLNLAYGLAMTQARVMDEANALAGLETPMTTEEALRDAQRKWIAFRDAACSAEAMLAAGGTAQPMIGTLCMERLTRTRTEDLRLFGEVN